MEEIANLRGAGIKVNLALLIGSVFGAVFSHIFLLVTDWFL